MRGFVAYLFGWMFIICSIVFSIHQTALDPDFYHRNYQSMNLALKLGVSEDDLNKSIDQLLDYILDKEETIDGTIVRNSKKQETFNEKEKKHMVDVKNLYQNVMKFAFVCFLGMMGILFYFLLWDKRLTLSYLTKGMIQAFFCLLIALAFFGIWIAYDFTAFWNWFHTLFFTNDLWLLNPATDFMICMLPEIIFNQLVLRISLITICILVPIFIFSLFYQLKKAPIGFEK